MLYKREYVLFCSDLVFNCNKWKSYLLNSLDPSKFGDNKVDTFI